MNIIPLMQFAVSADGVQQTFQQETFHRAAFPKFKSKSRRTKLILGYVY